MSQSFDVIVIGAGPGGYVAAIRAAQLGLKTACIDEWKNADGQPAPGGTCTNVGCIPSKALLQSSEHFEHAALHFAEHGIALDNLEIDAARMVERKAAIVRQTNEGILYLFKKNKVTFFPGRGAFVKAAGGAYEISVDGAETLTAPNIIIATGSRPRALPGAPFDEEYILSNEGALAMQEVPETLGIIGSGVIGLELGSVWRRLGAQVDILEGLPVFLGAADEQIAHEAKKAFEKQELNIVLGAKVGSVEVADGGVRVAYENAAGEAQELLVDKLIVSIGRVPNTEGLNADAVGLALGERGDIVVDAECRTNLPGVWAVGDVVRGPMLAHKAEEEGVAVAERIAGRHAHVDLALIPSVIYTSPEIAWVGKTEQQLKKENVPYRAGTFPFMANGRARAMGDTTGLVKILAHEKTDEILGVHIIGTMAGELIAEACTAMAFRASSEDIALICHAHPSLGESLREAALAVDGRALNF